MGKCISFGKYNQNYKYMFLYLIFRALNDSIYDWQNEDKYEKILFFGDDTKRFFHSHQLINYIFCYFGIFIISLFLIIFDSCLKNKNEINRTSNISLNSIQLIHNSPKDDLNYDECQIFVNVFLVVFLWIIQDLLIYIILSKMIASIDFWTFKMLFTYLLGKKMFNIEIYKHQIFAIYFISIVCSILLLILLIIDEKNIYRSYPYFIPIGILICLLNLLIESLSSWKAKWLMDLRFISSNKFLICYGILGFIIDSIICTITTFVDCGEDNFNFCKKNNNNNGKIYLENFSLYFKDISIKNIILVIFYVITFVLKSLFYLLTIKYLTPFHIISMPAIYYFLLHMVLGIYTIVKKKLANNLVNFILEISTCFLAFLAFSIFLEFIELNFCLCNYNLRRYIVRRSIIDSNINYEYEESMITEEENKENLSQSELSVK